MKPPPDRCRRCAASRARIVGYAASRLATTGERIIDIALDCGFENLGHFYKVFGRKFSASPRQYRLQQQRIVGPVA